MIWVLHFVLGLVSFFVFAALIYYFVPKGWRTIWTNLVTALPFVGAFLGSIFQNLQGIDFTQYLDKQTAMGIAFAVLIVNLILRSVTTTKVGG